MNRRWRWALMWLLLAAAAWLALFGDKTPPGAPKPAPRLAAVAQMAPGNRTAAPPEAIEPLQPRTAQAGESGGPEADLFRNAAWRAPPGPITAAVVAAIPAPTPVPPQPYRLIGKKLEAEVWEVFLGRNEMSFNVHTGDTLEGAWHVDRIEPPTLTLTHLSSGQKQTLDIGIPP